MDEAVELGKRGEELALGYLKGLGYIILEKNWRTARYEIDIIARDGSTLVIVEVKTRSGNYFAEPEFSVTRQKQKNLIRAANSYVYRKNVTDEVRFDIISILPGKEKPRINHLKDAFYATLR